MGNWGASANCTVGLCEYNGQDNACEAECVPSSTTCTGDNIGNPSGTPFSGQAAVGTCTAQGLFPNSPNCAGITDGGMGCCQGDTVCRTGRNGNPTGCLECIGSNVPGGNENGQTDTKCVSTDDQGDGGIEICTTTNTWPTTPSPLCPSGTSCTTSYNVPSCGVRFFCNDSACGDFPATNSNFLKFFGETCQDDEDGTPVLCGAATDCCSDYCSSNFQSGQTAICTANLPE
jgi:hypothetical protein